MIKKFILLITSFFSFKKSSFSQEKIELQDFNKIFDEETLNDISLVKIENYIRIEPTIILGKSKNNNLIRYQKGNTYYPENLKKIFDNPEISESSKIDFLKDALSDNSNDIFFNIQCYEPIEFFQSNLTANELLGKYYVKIENQLIGYFENRTETSIKYKDEGDLIYRLIIVGRHDLAYKYFEVLVDEFVVGKINYLNIGDRISNQYQDYFFDILCCSPNKEVAEKSKELLFKYLSFSENIDISILGKYLDETRNLKILMKWFSHYSQINFDSFSNLDSKNVRVKFEQKGNVLPYFNFMLSNSDYLAPKFGELYWKEFLSKMDFYFKLYPDKFFEIRISILKDVFRDESLSQNKKKQILLESGAKFSDYNISQQLFIWLVSKSFSNKKLTLHEYQHLDLNKYAPYSKINSFTSDYEEILPLRHRSFESNIEIDTFLTEFENAFNTEMENLSELQRFKLHYQPFLEYFKKILLESKSAIILQSDYKFEVDYNEIFKNKIKPFLASKGIENIEFDYNKNKFEESYYQYNLFSFSRKSGFKSFYTTHSSTFFNGEKVIKLINSNLKENDIKERFCRIYNIDWSNLYILEEPSKFKSFFDKYLIIFGVNN